MLNRTWFDGLAYLRLGRDLAFPVHDLIHGPRIDAKMTGEAILAQAQRFHEFFEKDFPRMYRRRLFHISFTFLDQW
jgi:hypothetical protein